MVGEFSIMHWLVVFAIVLIVFGPKRLPDLAKALCTGIRDFKKALAGEEQPKEPEKLTQSPTSQVSAAKKTDNEEVH